MRSYTLVMSVMFLFSAFSAAGQHFREQPKYQPKVVNKGYYSIGNNGQKLTPPSPLPVTQVTVSGPEARKGYYATGTNRKKLPSQAGFIPLSRKRPMATKGYYSIGNNAEKLKH